MSIFSIALCALPLAALLVLCNLWSIRLIGASNSGDTRSKKSLWKASGAMLLNYVVLVVIGALWFLVAAVTTQSDMLHESGVGTGAVIFAVLNPALLFMFMFLGRD